MYDEAPSERADERACGLAGKLAIGDYDTLGAREVVRALFVLRARLVSSEPRRLLDELRRIEVHEVLHRRRRQVLEALRRARTLP